MNASTRSGVIYGLRQPGGPIRYVGKTVADPNRRLSTHLNRARKGSQTACHSWLRKHGLTAEIVILESRVPEGELNARERYWIAKLRPSGHLLNHTDGGDGGATRFGPKPADEVERLKISLRDRVMPPGHTERAKAGKLARQGGPVCCLRCRREFATTTALAAHRGSVHNGGNVKRAESMRRYWATNPRRAFSG